MSAPAPSSGTATRSLAVPRYRDLPVAPGGGRSAWGVFGAGDSVGAMNRITPETVAAAARLVRTGETFPLDVPVGTVDPPLFNRGLPRHTVIHRRPHKSLDDVVDNLYPQSGSQWDSLAHIAYRPDEFYNGATLADVVDGGRNTADHWARRGIATRGVLLDVSERVRERGGAGESVAVTPDDLEEARALAGLEFSPGNLVMVRTGFLEWYATQPADVRLRLSRPELLRAVGLERSERTAEYLWDSGACGVVSDTAGLECWPPDRSPEAFPFGYLHQVLLGLLGLPIGELWALDALAAASRADGVWESFVVSAPLGVAGAIGSPANATAIR